MLTFGFGYSCIALFARVGSGIFIKVTDSDTKHVIKVGAGIAEKSECKFTIAVDSMCSNACDVATMDTELN